MGRNLTEPEKLFIENHYKMGDMNVEEMASHMPGIGVKTINKHIDNIPKENVSEEPAPQKPSRNQSGRIRPEDFQTGNLIGRHKYGKASSVVMTEAASEMSESRKQYRKPKPLEERVRTKNTFIKPFGKGYDNQDGHEWIQDGNPK